MKYFSLHTIIYGDTGSGKSNLLQYIFVQLLNQKSKATFYFFDPKRVEFINYEEYKEINIEQDTDKMIQLLEKLENNENPVCIFIDEIADLFQHPNFSIQTLQKLLANKNNLIFASTSKYTEQINIFPQLAIGKCNKSIFQKYIKENIYPIDPGQFVMITDKTQDLIKVPLLI